MVEFPGATKTIIFLDEVRLSVTGVTRMLPAVAAWDRAKRQPGVLSIDGRKYDLLDIAGSALVNGTNPAHKDYWQASRLRTRRISDRWRRPSSHGLRGSFGTRLLPQVSVTNGSESMGGWPPVQSFPCAKITGHGLRRSNTLRVSL